MTPRRKPKAIASRLGELVLTWPLVLLYAACASPDLGDVPFVCNPGAPECPAGYQCDRQGSVPVCIRSNLARVDAATLDRGIETPDAGQSDAPTAAGLVVITEVMANPEAVADDFGEYIELFNAGDQPVDLDGWSLVDRDNDRHVLSQVGGIIVPARSFFVLGRSSNPAQNGGVPVDYVFTNFFLSNEADEIILRNRAAKDVAALLYSSDAGFSIPLGASISVRNPLGDLSDSDNWCTETSPWGASAGDKGTPGTSPGCN